MDNTEEAPKRPRGRPRKETVTDENNLAPVESATTEDEIEVMQNQFKFQLAQMLKMAKQMGVSMEELFEAPPAEDAVVLQPTTEAEIPAELGAPAEVKVTQQRRPDPGTVLPGGSWIPWTKADLGNDPNDYVENFVPAPIPTMVYPMLDELGRQKIKLDINDLVGWYTVGVPQRIHKMFWATYMQLENQWRELENFKRNGPSYAPWGAVGPDGRKAWHFEPAALTFGMDLDGRYLRSVPGWSGPTNEAPAAETTE